MWQKAAAHNDGHGSDEQDGTVLRRTSRAARHGLREQGIVRRGKGSREVEAVFRGLVPARSGQDPRSSNC